jgi:hypothetical protein
MTSHVIARSLLVAIATAVLLFGANPVCRVIGTGTIEVDGIKTPAHTFVPASTGEVITTREDSAIVQFPDGSSVTIQPHSSVRVEAAGRNAAVRVVSGATTYDRSRAPAIAGSSTARPAGSSIPGSAILTGAFIPAQTGGSGTIGPEIALSDGVTLNLSATTNLTTGAVTYTIASVSTTVSLPGGQTSTLTITSGALIGDTVSFRQSAPGTISGVLTITAPGGTTITNPNTVVQNTVTAGVATAITSNTVPSGSSATPAPVSPKPFSPSGS